MRGSLRYLTAAAWLAAAGSAHAVEIAAPYVPTAPSVVERMLEIARVGRDDYVIDLGSGDGRIVIAAARKFGARGFGVEIDPKLVTLANANARAAGVDDRVRFYERDLFATDLSEATVITIYLLARATMKLRPALLRLKPGTRIMSHAASMGEWKSDHFEMLDVKDKVRPDAPRRTYIHFWIVPAQVAGTWRWSLPVGSGQQEYELTIRQDFQWYSGALRIGDSETGIEGKLEGARMTLAFSTDVEGRPVQHRLTGEVAGGSITGTAVVTTDVLRSEAEWKAVRLAPSPAAYRPVGAAPQ